MDDFWGSWDSDELEEDAAAETAAKSDEKPKKPVAVKTHPFFDRSSAPKKRNFTSKKPSARNVFESSPTVAPTRWILGDSKMGKTSTRLILTGVEDPQKGRIFMLSISHPESENKYLKFRCSCEMWLVLVYGEDGMAEVREEAGVHGVSCKTKPLSQLLNEGQNWSLAEKDLKDLRNQRKSRNRLSGGNSGEEAADLSKVPSTDRQPSCAGEETDISESASLKTPSLTDTPAVPKTPQSTVPATASSKDSPTIPSTIPSTTPSIKKLADSPIHQSNQSIKMTSAIPSTPPSTNLSVDQFDVTSLHQPKESIAIPSTTPSTASSTPPSILPSTIPSTNLSVDQFDVTSLHQPKESIAIPSTTPSTYSSTLPSTPPSTTPTTKLDFKSLTTVERHMKRFNNSKTELFVKTTPKTGYKYEKTEMKLNKTTYKCVNCPSLAYASKGKAKITHIKADLDHKPPCQPLDFEPFLESLELLSASRPDQLSGVQDMDLAGAGFDNFSENSNVFEGEADQEAPASKRPKFEGHLTRSRRERPKRDLQRQQQPEGHLSISALSEIFNSKNDPKDGQWRVNESKKKNPQTVSEKRTSAHPLMFYRPSELWLSDCCRKLHLDGSRLDEAYDVWNRLRKVDLDAPQFPEVGQVKTFASGFGLVSCLFTGADSAVETVKESVNRCFFNRYREMDPEMTFETAVRVMNEEDMGRFHWRSLSILLGCAVVVFDYGARKKQVYRAKVEGQCPAVVVGLKFDEYFLFLK